MKNSERLFVLVILLAQQGETSLNSNELLNVMIS